MIIQEEFEIALHRFYKEIDFLVNLVFYAHQSQKSIKVKIFCDKVGTILDIFFKGNHWVNRAETYIALLKEEAYKDMRAFHSPIALWGYVIKHRSLIHSTIP